MAFLDETGLAELWSLIKESDATVEALANTKAKIATGSYTGTGKYDSSNKNSLTFDFVPKLVFIMGPSSEYAGFWVYGQDRYIVLRTTSPTFGTTSLSGNTLSWWYAGGTAQNQLNTSGKTFAYVAIG